MTDAKFPRRFRCSADALGELALCETGSYEDHILGDVRLGEYADGKLHIVEILERFRTVIVMENQAELDEVFAQAVSGTWSLRCPQSCQRLYDELGDYVSPAVKETWVYTNPRIGF